MRLHAGKHEIYEEPVTQVKENTSNLTAELLRKVTVVEFSKYLSSNIDIYMQHASLADT